MVTWDPWGLAGGTSATLVNGQLAKFFFGIDILDSHT